MEIENIKRVLLENAKEYYNNGVRAEKDNNYNTAVTLYFKSINALCDLFIVVKEKIFPTNHAERFRILEAKYLDIYSILDESFPLYQDSYKARLNKEDCEVLRKDAERIAQILDIVL